MTGRVLKHFKVLIEFTEYDMINELMKCGNYSLNLSVFYIVEIFRAAILLLLLLSLLFASKVFIGPVSLSCRWQKSNSNCLKQKRCIISS